MLVAVQREEAPGEKRVALDPRSVARLRSAGVDVAVAQGAGEESGLADSLYAEAGARVVPGGTQLLATCDLLVRVQTPSVAEIGSLREGAVLVAPLYAAANPAVIAALEARRTTAFALELIPRTARAQAMDVLSSQSSIAGYKAAVIAADTLPRLFPLMMTAAGTVAPARVLVIGAGVAGLQAIATARRLGARVQAYDIRPAAKEEVESLGARFLEIPLSSPDAQDTGGYARAQSAEVLRRQGELLASAVAESDVVITTAAVPGRRAPVLVTAEAVARMRPGSVIVDAAADQGGNCAVTEPGRTVQRGHVTVAGPLNLPSAVAHDASRMYGHNVAGLLLHLIHGGSLRIDPADDITRATMVTRDGTVVHEGVLASLRRAGGGG